MELAIITYIKENGLAKAIKEFNLITRVYDSKILLKYNQIESPLGIREVQECRGLILEKDTLKVMSLSFVKFFNAEEGKAAKIDWNTAKVLKKEDGCCHEDTTLITEDGEKTIREICETEYNGKVLSFDIENEELIYDDIITHSVKKNINNWFAIELEDGTTIKLTSNHKVWLPNLGCYRRVDELTEDDEFLLIT
jgi:hypothetical protein